MEIANFAMECADSTFCMSPILGWQSTRISFCQDIPGDRFSIERLGMEEILDDYSTDFEFCMVQNDADPAVFGQTMLTADELFLDGKLLPLHISPQIIHQETDDATPTIAAEPEPEPETETKDETTETVENVRLENVQSSVECGSNAVPITPKYPTLSHRWKEIFRIGKLQVATSREGEYQENKKGAKKESNSSGFALSLRQPLSPRSIWPFSRSSSAGDGKANSASCSLASSRSNSAGDSNYKTKASSAPCSRSNSGGDSKLKARNASTSKIHADFNTKPVRMFSNSTCSSSSSLNIASESVHFSVAPARQDTCSCPILSTPTVSTTEGTSMSKPGVICDVSPPETTTHNLSNKKKNGRTTTKQKRSPRKTSTDGVQGSTPTRNRGCASPGRAFKMRSPSGNYGRGSPVRIIGRSGAVSGSPGRAGSGKFMIKNLERCTANSKKAGKSQDSVWPGRHKEGLNATDRTSSYSNGVRVLNVPVCMGHPSVSNNNRLFNFRGLFSRKEKECSLVN